jgi:hypothetical protein
MPTSTESNSALIIGENQFSWLLMALMGLGSELAVTTTIYILSLHYEFPRKARKLEERHASGDAMEQNNQSINASVLGRHREHRAAFSKHWKAPAHADAS